MQEFNLCGGIYVFLERVVNVCSVNIVPAVSFVCVSVDEWNHEFEHLK